MPMNTQELNDTNYELPFGLSVNDESSRKIWSLLSCKIDIILSNFYSDISESTLKSYLDGVNVQDLMKIQKRHWEKICLGEIDPEYTQQMKRMHLKHLTIGLPNIYYVASYLYFLRNFHQVIYEKVSDKAVADELINAIDAIVSVDIVRAMTVYEKSVLLD